MQYTELHCKTNFSFLRGASHPEECVERASELGYRGLAITDWHSVAGVVRGFVPAKEAGLQLIVGAEIHPRDMLPMVLWASDRASYGQLCRLLSRGRMRCEKGACELAWSDVVEGSEGLLAGIDIRPGREAVKSLRKDPHSNNIPSRSIPRELHRFRDHFGDRGYLLCQLHRGVDDAAWVERYQADARQSRLPLLAVGDVHYHTPERMLMHDCVTAIRNGTTIDHVHPHRFSNSQRHLRSLAELKRLYASVPEALERTGEVADRCTFQLDELRYEYPEELAPAGMTASEHLRRLVWEGACQRWPAGVPDKIIKALRHEIELIDELHYEAYFLTVWDLVRFARERGILCQGRGSAANSVVCYCLGITNVDPSQTELLFERFISRERDEAPDIDVDFEHQRREEVLQYLYSKYGRQRAGLTATVITYRIKSAIREAGKALGLSADRIDGLAKLSGHHGSSADLQERCRQAGLDPASEIGKRFVYLTTTLTGFPRHLSQHVGGMVMTRGDLCELCPIENAAMADRTVIQWDKDDLDALGILKVDVLALGMLSALRRMFEMVELCHGTPISLATIPSDDTATFDMICEADTMGVFQIESRAQMSMLPRLRPRCYYDLVIEVAIVRPGPIQGNMVHPFLKARQNPEAVVYPNEAVKGVLERTLGVPIFQEQAMRLAVVAAGFTPGEADQLRRAMAAWRRPGVIDRFRTKLLDGMRASGFPSEFAEHVFQQIRSFGEYGFPESHAASFALLVYASAYLKCHYPAVFCTAILNSQPMGFYAPAQLIADARRHGVEVLPADINRGEKECTLQWHQAANRKAGWAVRLGLQLVKGLPEQAITRLLNERERGGPYRDVADLTRRTGLGQAVLQSLADADALNSITSDRRAALWQSLAQEKKPRAMPLLAACDADDDEPPPQSLAPMTPCEEVYADYETTGLSLRGHPLHFCRDELRQMRCVTAAELPKMRDGRHVRVAGLVILRQRPSTAKGITFVTLEDETGPINLVLFVPVWDRFYKIACASNAWLVDGKLENKKGVIHVVVGRLQDLSGPTRGIVVPSRDFH